MQRIFISMWFCLISVFTGTACDAASAPQPIQNPIPEKIRKGDIVVEAVNFIRGPKTVDARQGPTKLDGIDTPLGSSNAYARLQYMLPIRDGSGRLVVSDLRGILYITDRLGENLDVYLDLRKATSDLGNEIFPNEAGFLGFAFHPDFAKKDAPGYGKFYTGYSARRGTGTAQYLDDDAISHYSVIREWTAENPAANAFTGPSREIFRAGQFAQNHNIGTMSFNPYVDEDSIDYGKLYVCLGDGGSAFDPKNYGQGLSEPLGAILRIDPLGGDRNHGYGIPMDNPFFGSPDVAQEIWAYGLRHPQQFSFDIDGRMFINDIGQNHVEEVNIGIAGANYGWRVREGTFATGYGVEGGYAGALFPRPADEQPFVYPVAQYDHDEGNAISSGFVYRGKSIKELRGKYLFADIVRGRVFYFAVKDIEPGHPAELRELRIKFGGKEREIIDVAGYENTYAPATKRADLRLGIDDDGEIYLLTKGDGWIRKLMPLN